MVSASKISVAAHDIRVCILQAVLPFLVNGSFSSFSVSRVHPLLAISTSSPGNNIPPKEASYIDARNAQDMHIEPVLV